ncbi:hypothetical protein [[Acidovorax] ebreus]|jgi:hypothetical protein|uniref:Uncharacterized protein n=1 Tax=Acidovorax ebreus (strain TPSY) TaxID=535289 RepID=A0A9J9UBV8_ACIET|nr:hypothetical protein [[Acidovorax] ebreus]ACM34944.1 hypothetical protein Dtpsy_3519 [[Acidovorax] ebreus TPSY]UOB03759.1 hypothetical protein MRB47_09765 [Diaphorobacter sp. LI3]
MLFRYFRSDDVFVRALRAAVASHRPAALHALLASHGDRAFAKALSDLSGRVIADALSMLPASNRAGVLNRLSLAARNRLRENEGSHARDSLYARSAASGSPLFLLW